MNKQVWIEKALGLGIQEFEIYQSTTVEKEMTWFQGQMDTLVSSKSDRYKYSWNCRWKNGQYGIGRNR